MYPVSILLFSEDQSNIPDNSHKNPTWVVTHLLSAWNLLNLYVLRVSCANASANYRHEFQAQKKHQKALFSKQLLLIGLFTQLSTNLLNLYLLRVSCANASSYSLYKSQAQKKRREGAFF